MSKIKSKMRISLKRILSVFLTLMLVQTAIPFTSLAESVGDFATSESESATLELNSGTSADLQNKVDETNDGDAIQSTSDVDMQQIDTFATSESEHATLKLNGGTSTDLQNKINEANDGDIILINGTIDMRDLVTVNKDIRLKGSGHLVCNNNHDTAFSMIKIEFPGKLTMEEITINGNQISNNSEAIEVSENSEFIMESGTISGNSALFYGGGIYNDRGTVTINGGTISENFAIYGGGIYNSGILIINGGTISGNSASENGGGIHNSSTGTVTINGGEISANTSNFDYSCGGGIYNEYGTVTISSGTISGNSASLCQGGGICNCYGTLAIKSETIISGNNAKYGGGIRNYKGTVTISGGTISGNVASDGSGITNDGTMIMKSGTISGNTASGLGGGIENIGTLTMNGGTISGNTASDLGGGVYNRGTFNVRGAATVIDNGDNKDNNVRIANSNHPIIVTGKCIGKIKVSAPRFNQTAVKAIPQYTISQTDAACFEADGENAYLALVDNTLVYREIRFVNGGTSDDLQNAVNEIYNYGIILVSETVELNRSVTIDGKSISILGKDNAVLIRGNVLTGNMLILSNGSTLIIGNLTIDGNKYERNDIPAGSAIKICDRSTLTMKSGTIQNNKTTYKGGGVNIESGTFEMISGEISQNDAEFGGGICNGGTFRMLGGTISKNTAKYGDEQGGGVYNENSFEMIDGIISDNTSEHGGGVYNSEYGTFKMNSGTISGNTAKIAGGGVYNNKFIQEGEGTFEMVGGTIIENTAQEGMGGGVYNYGRFKMSDGMITKNAVQEGSGGGVYNTLIFEMTGGEISKNTVSGENGSGAGVLNIFGTFTLNGGTISNNKASYMGGGIANNIGTIKIINGTIQNNSATIHGGGVFNDIALLEIENGIISQNESFEGGGVYNAGECIINGGTISENKANGLGGGIYNDEVGNNGYVTVNSGKILNNTSKLGGAGIYNNSKLNMYGGEIVGNIVTNDNMVGSGVLNDDSIFNIKGQVKIINNGKDNNDNVFLRSSVIYVVGECSGLVGISGPEYGERVAAGNNNYTISKSDAACFNSDNVSAYLELVDNSLVTREKKTTWGQMVQVNGVAYYIDEDGMASAEVTGNHEIWLNTKLDGSGNWYCIDNSNGLFRTGSRFYVQVIDDISKYYDKIGSEHRDKIEDGKLKIFLIGVTDPDGKEYTTLDSDLNCYVKIDSDWDKDKLNAIFINGEMTEKVDIEYVGTIESPSSGDKFIKLVIKHFSPYAIYQAKSNNVEVTQIDTNNSTLTGSFATGENFNYIYIISLWTASIVALSGIVILKRKFNK